MAVAVMLLFTSLFIGKITFGFQPWVFELERPYLALAVFLSLSGLIVFIYLAVPRELLNRP